MTSPATTETTGPDMSPDVADAWAAVYLDVVAKIESEEQPHPNTRQLEASATAASPRMPAAS